MIKYIIITIIEKKKETYHVLRCLPRAKDVWKCNESAII